MITSTIGGVLCSHFSIMDQRLPIPRHNWVLFDGCVHFCVFFCFEKANGGVQSRPAREGRDRKGESEFNFFTYFAVITKQKSKKTQFKEKSKRITIQCSHDNINIFTHISLSTLIIIILQMHRRYTAILKYIPIRFTSFCVYSAYLYGIQQLTSHTLSILNIIISIAIHFYRIFLTHLFSSFHKDMTIYMTLLALPCYQAMFFTFAAPAYKTTASAYFTAAIDPMTYLMWGVLHQTETWFRFRNWLKVCVM